MKSLTSVVKALRRTFSPPTEAVAETSGAPAANPYYRTDIDLEAMRSSAGTDLEKLYYGHDGKLIFKWKHYLPLYDQSLGRFVGRKLKVLEIGVAHGGSAQLWRQYFGHDAHIIGLDIVPETAVHAEPGIEIVIGDQGDSTFLEELAASHGPFDIVIDDGSHISSHQITSFETLFPHVKDGGVYVCEDLHTSYWPDWGGGLGRDDTFIAYLKRIIDRIHARYHAGAAASDEITDRIGSFLFADSIVFFFKAPKQDTYMIPVPASAAEG